MRILHTADWHLGKKLGTFSRIEEQVKVMEEIINIAEDNAVDAILIAGDVFDAANPPTEALELFYSTVKRLSKEGSRLVVVIAGNHDSPDKIDAPDPLARASGIIFVGYPNALVKPMQLPSGMAITIADKGFIEARLPGVDYPLRLLLTPYANEQRLKQFLGIEDKEALLNETLQQQWQSIADQYMDTKGVNVLMAHLFVMQRGGTIPEEPDGEKPIKIGNADLVYTDIIPAQIQYTALGHLHRHHQVAGHQQPVAYSSSPLAYSFSEAGQSKYVCLVTLEPGQDAHVEKIALQSGRSLYRKTFDDIDIAVDWLAAHPYSLVELTIKSDTYLQSEDLRRLQQAHDGIIQIIPQVRLHKLQDKTIKHIDIEQDISSLFADYFRSKHKQEPNKALMALFQEILQEK
ncbi:exonuclease sbcCD subunit D [Taibaiella sp. KBW10]|uniref:metallophosphoesterase family protein n=1 Tax=Taibaiella sp. KBW10 TaxID=2153357 RepID=UPI000F5B2715|nr:exonuclease subunit SbcD [Taibaiella sp. KBW10]RQO30648.1 exonuclease sbcCD subunit D [Taibaiella sp. KBW10]